VISGCFGGSAIHDWRSITNASGNKSVHSLKGFEGKGRDAILVGSPVAGSIEIRTGDIAAEPKSGEASSANDVCEKTSANEIVSDRNIEAPLRKPTRQQRLAYWLTKPKEFRSFAVQAPRCKGVSKRNQKMKLKFASALIVSTIAGLAALPSTARAGCHLIDCVEPVYVAKSQLKPLSCETLWILRNSIYKDHKYCFKTARAINWFGNAGCLYDEVSDVPLPKVQRGNISRIKLIEAAKAC
jgi:hypothetical protein